jgi:hypothetical protein
MRITPHLIIALALVALALLIAVPAGLSATARWPSPVRDFRLSAAASSPVPAQRATAPVVAGLDNAVRDIFTLRSVGNDNNGDLPPPPPLTLPALPVLPLPER